MKALKLINFTLAILLCLFSLNSLANQVTEVQISATAETEEKAITKALAQAIQQVNGVQVNVNIVLTETLPEIIFDWQGNKTVITVQDVNVGYTQTYASGPVESYSVVSSKHLKADKLWEVTIKAKVLSFTNIGEDRSHLIKLAIMPFHVLQPSFQTPAGETPAVDVSRELGYTLTTQLVQANRFRVLDRNYWQEAAIEAQVIQEFGTSTNQAIQLGQKLGADYILVGLIKQFDIKPEDLNVYGTTISKFKAEFELNYRVIEVSTGEIIWSEDIHLKHDKEALEAMLDTLMPRPALSNVEEAEAEAEKAMQSLLYKATALTISQRMSHHFYPVKVLKQLDDTTVALTQGSPHIIEGDIYQLFTAATQATDPDTGMTINIPGKVVATVKVISVAADHAVAELISGTMSNMSAGAIVRKKTPVQQPPQSKKDRPLSNPGASDKPLKWD